MIPEYDWRFDALLVCQGCDYWFKVWRFSKCPDYDYRVDKGAAIQLAVIGMEEAQKKLEKRIQQSRDLEWQANQRRQRLNRVEEVREKLSALEPMPALSAAEQAELQRSGVVELPDDFEF